MLRRDLRAGLLVLQVLQVLRVLVVLETEVPRPMPPIPSREQVELTRVSRRRKGSTTIEVPAGRRDLATSNGLHAFASSV